MEIPAGNLIEDRLSVDMRHVQVEQDNTWRPLLNYGHSLPAVCTGQNVVYAGKLKSGINRKKDSFLVINH
jgi:hypothetical protein